MISLQVELISGIYYIYFTVKANQNLPGSGYYIELSLPLFIYDIIFYGDVNLDQKVDILDVIITQEIIYGNLSDTLYSMSLIDLNFDGSPNIHDVILIINKILMES